MSARPAAKLSHAARCTPLSAVRSGMSRATASSIRLRNPLPIISCFPKRLITTRSGGRSSPAAMMPATSSSTLASSRQPPLDIPGC